MNFSLALHDPYWRPILSIPEKSVNKPITNGILRTISKAARTVDAQFGCYAWSTRSQIYFCGAFACDYTKAGFKTNLEGALHYYFASENDPCAGRASLGPIVHERANKLLEQEDLYLQVLAFEGLKNGRQLVSFEEFTKNVHLVQAVLALVTHNYRQAGESLWNQAPTGERHEMDQSERETWRFTGNDRNVSFG